MELARSKQKLIISPTVGDAPMPEVGLDALPVASPQHFSAAERIFDTLIEQIREQCSEKLVSHHVAEFHRLLRNRINQPAAINELAGARYQSFEKVRQFLGHDCKVAIQYHQYLTGSGAESSPHIFSFRDRW